MGFNKEELINFLKEIHEIALVELLYKQVETLKWYWQGRINFIEKVLEVINDFEAKDDLINFLRNYNIEKRFYTPQNDQEKQYIKGELDVIKEIYGKFKNN